MKQFVIFISIAVLTAVTISSCSDTTYAQELKQEQTLIKDYIKRNSIRVISKLPVNNVWGPNDYYLSSTGLYFHLSNPGVGTDTLELMNTVIPLYIQISLTKENPDTISNWSTVDSSYPLSFIYGNASESSSAFQEAASYMKKNDSEAKIIVPSKINFDTFWKPATPVAYILKIRIKK